MGGCILTRPIYANNTNAIQIATNLVFHELIKHIEVNCHSVPKAYDNYAISLPHISSQLQLVYIFSLAN